MRDFPLDEDLNSPPISPSPSDSTQLDFRMSKSNDPWNDLSSDLEEMTPTHLHSTWASGNIPVLLYDEEYAQIDQEVSEKEFSISDLTIASAMSVNTGMGLEENDRRSSYVPMSSWSGVNDAPGRTSRLSWTNRRDSGFLGLQSLDSSNTISSVGTFGPRRKNHRNESKEQNIPLSDAKTLSSTASSPASDQQENQDDCVFTGGTLKNRPSIPHNLAGIFASPSVLADLKRASLVETQANLSETSGTHKQRHGSSGRNSITELEADISLTIEQPAEDNVLESPSTPRKPIPKTISWISSRDWDCQQYKEYVAQADLSFSPQSPTRGPRRRSSGQGLDENEDMNPAPNHRLRRSPIRSLRVLENRDLNAIVETPRASQFSREIYDHHIEKSIHRETRHPSPTKNPIHQDEHRWLKDITVQFLIDQEGFRAAHPSFKFSGIIRLRQPQNNNNSKSNTTTTMAQFRPITRQAFHFHYAPFESPPILRRVTINHDETHDYLTKQALLTLKSNGVYVLHGQEIPTSPAESHSLEPAKLQWQFEYMIDDRRVEASGRIMEGEKNFIPLTFSCSPGLLLPTQGKRNSIMHVFKKGLAMKLVSEKLQPPGMSPVPSQPPTMSGKSAVNEAHHPNPSSNFQGDAAHIANFFTTKAHSWNIHKRGQSHGVQNTSPSKHKTQLRNMMEATAGTVSPQHRRALSGGENLRPSAGLHFTSTDGVSSAAPLAESRNAAVSVTIPPARHIIPPQKLAELLDNGSPPSNDSNVRQSVPTLRRSNAFSPLTPRPRNNSHAHARGLSQPHSRTP